MMHRRKFIKQTSLALTAAAIGPGLLSMDRPAQPLGIQLYSLREDIKRNVELSLKKIAQIGFKEVETFGYSLKNKFWGINAKEFKDILDRLGLNSPSGHYNFGTFLRPDGTIDNFQYVLEVAKMLDQEYIIIPSIPKDLRGNIDDYKRVSEKMNQAGLLCKDAGIKLAYHNHAFEFEEFNGKNGYETLLKNTDDDLVFFQMDIYWVVRGGQDPVKLIMDNPGRFPLWHVKDMNKYNNDLNVEIGHGSIDFKEIFSQAQKAGTEHYILEQENFDMNPYTSLDVSYNYIKDELF